MSDRSNFSSGPRANPLYGGPGGGNPGARTPSWAKKNSPPAGRQSPYSDGASTPPDSPPRSGRSNYGPSYYAPQYENPGYTVETPGHFHDVSSSPYRPPAYFVQTPAHSERAGLINDTPMSSAPSSPPHFGPNGTPLYSDTKSGRSGRSWKSGKFGGTKSGKPISKIDEEEEEYFPDQERTTARKRRFWKCCMAWSCVLVVILLAAAITAVIIVFEPKAPKYFFSKATVNGFQLVSGSDSNGLPTEQLYANITVSFIAYNPNTRFKLENDGGILKLGYSSIPVLMQNDLPKFNVGKKKMANFSTSVSTMAYPMYGAGPTLRGDIAENYVPLTFRATIKSHVSVLWMIIQSEYKHKMNCILNIDPIKLRSVNSTCNLNTKQVKS